MNIALIAHDAKKELMTEFCIAYCGILSRHNLCATGATARQISEATGLTIEPYLGGIQGGGEQVLARISCDEIDLVIYFRDPQSADESLDFSRLPVYVYKSNTARRLKKQIDRLFPDRDYRYL